MFVESKGPDSRPTFSVYGHLEHHHFQWSHYVHVSVYESSDDGVVTLIIYMSNCQIVVKGKRFAQVKPHVMWNDHFLLSASIDKIEDPNEPYIQEIRLVLPN